MAWWFLVLVICTSSCMVQLSDSETVNEHHEPNLIKDYQNADSGKNKNYSYYKYPFQNTSMNWSDRVDDLVGRLTLEELVKQSMTSYGKPTPAISRLGIKPYVWITECLRGQVKTNTTAFPQSLGLAASFSPELLMNMSMALSYEVRAHWNNNVQQGIYKTSMGLNCFSPVVNIMRHPLWGRNQETYGEDPYLTSMLGQAFVLGLQGDHSQRYIRAAAGCKHFDVYGGPENIPIDRFHFDAKVSMQDLRMTFLPAFKTCVEADTQSIMCSHNAVNGVPACAHKQLLTSIARREWGFTGFVVSDAHAILYIISKHHYLNTTEEAAAAAINAGCNLELATTIFNSIPKAIGKGTLTEVQFRESMKPLFYTRMRLGEFDPVEMNPYNKISMSVVQSPEHRNLALTAAIKTFVLLKNINNTLPLKKIYNKIALVGPMANNVEQQYGSYGSDVDDDFVTTPLHSLAKLAHSFTFASGCDDNKCDHYNVSQIEGAVKGSDIVIVCLGTGQQLESEKNDRSNIDLPGFQLDLLKNASHFTEGGTPVILLLFNGGPLDIAWAKLSDKISAIMECFFPAQSTGEALHRALTAQGNGDIPGGRLPATWPADLHQVGNITDYSMTGKTYRYYRGDPLYPFGFGLSYSRFEYSKLSVNPSRIVAGMDVKASVRITNTGRYDADEVVQFYMSWENSTLPAPRYQLVGFQRIFLKREHTTEVSVEITNQQMQLWINDNTKFTTPKGIKMIYAGGQQPNQKTTVPSNVLSSSFTII